MISLKFLKESYWNTPWMSWNWTEIAPQCGRKQQHLSCQSLCVSCLYELIQTFWHNSRLDLKMRRRCERAWMNKTNPSPTCLENLLNTNIWQLTKEEKNVSIMSHLLLIYLSFITTAPKFLEFFLLFLWGQWLYRIGTIPQPLSCPPPSIVLLQKVFITWGALSLLWRFDPLMFIHKRTLNKKKIFR